MKTRQRRHQRHTKHHKPMPDLSETKAHIFIAGHELLKAAEGMLKFCKAYVQSTSECKKHPHVVHLFTKGISIAKELGASMTQEAPLKGTTGKIMHHFCDTIEKEIRQEKKTKARKRATPRRTAKKRKTATSRRKTK